MNNEVKGVFRIGWAYFREKMRSRAEKKAAALKEQVQILNKVICQRWGHTEVGGGWPRQYRCPDCNEILTKYSRTMRVHYSRYHNG